MQMPAQIKRKYKGGLYLGIRSKGNTIGRLGCFTYQFSISWISSVNFVQVDSDFDIGFAPKCEKGPNNCKMLVLFTWPNN
jgi:hypothetical protein